MSIENVTLAALERDPFNERNIQMCQMYVSRFSDMMRRNCLLLLWGNAGTGKSYAAAGIANGVIQNGFSAELLTFEDLLNHSHEGDEELNAYLEQIYLPRKMYDEMNLVNLYYQENFKQLYGSNGENISDEEAMQYLVDGGYMRADHILLMTVDASYQPLEESVVAEKKAQAESIAAELAAIENAEERIARFYELKAEYTEDSGAAYYTEGYTFAPGTMVSAFEEGHNSLADNEISGVVESEYGCHIMLRLPLNVDAVIDFPKRELLSLPAAFWQTASTAKLCRHITTAWRLSMPKALKSPIFLTM